MQLRSWIRRAASLCPALFLFPWCVDLLPVSLSASQCSLREGRLAITAALQCWGVRDKASQLETKFSALSAGCTECNVCARQTAPIPLAHSMATPLVCVSRCSPQLEWAKCVRQCSEHSYLLSAPLINALPSTLSLFGVLALCLW